MAAMKPKMWARIPTDTVSSMIELARTVAETFPQNEKFRAVVDYDPKASKTIVTFFTEQDEHNPPECPEPPQWAYPTSNEKPINFKGGNTFTISEEETKEMLETLDEQERPIIELSPFMVEDDGDNEIIIRHAIQKEGPLRLTRRDALALAEIIKNHCQSW